MIAGADVGLDDDVVAPGHERLHAAECGDCGGGDVRGAAAAGDGEHGSAGACRGPESETPAGPRRGVGRRLRAAARGRERSSGGSHAGDLEELPAGPITHPPARVAGGGREHTW